MNIIHSNGVRGELQFRGPLTNYFGEYEHIAYDLRQGKNTLGPLFNDYKREISKLPDWKYENIMLILKDVIIIITVLNWAYPQQNQNFLKVLTKFYLKKI